MMKTVEEVIVYLENEVAYCMEMHEEYKGKDAANSFQYLLRAVTIEGLLAEIKEGESN